MIFGKTKMELKVGIFVFFGLVILVAFVLFIGKFNTWNSGYRINFLFNFVNGVKVGAPVRFAGVDVGEVKEVLFIKDPKEGKLIVKLDSWVKNEIKIPQDSTVWVNTLGLMGERYIEVMPGKDFNLCLAEGSTLRGTDPIAMHEVAQIVRDIAVDLDESIKKIKNKEGTVGKLLYDDAIYKEFEIIAREFELLATDLRKHPWKLLFRGKEKK